MILFLPYKENDLTEYFSSSPEETMEIAAEFAEKLKEGDVIALDGDLGAGKTCFVKGIAASLGITDHITSPTFNIVKEYYGRLKLYHFDVYRIDDIDELFQIGFEEYLNDSAVSIIEWAELIDEALPEIIIRVSISGSGYEKRHIVIEGELF